MDGSFNVCGGGCTRVMNDRSSSSTIDPVGREEGTDFDIPGKEILSITAVSALHPAIVGNVVRGSCTRIHGLLMIAVFIIKKHFEIQHPPGAKLRGIRVALLPAPDSREQLFSERIFTFPILTRYSSLQQCSTRANTSLFCFYHFFFRRYKLTN